MAQRRIEDFALIGDLHTAALVARDGSIVWLCIPRFDSDSAFASMLGTPENGEWSLKPACEVSETQRQYRGDTLILETVMRCSAGAVRVIDFMPRREEHPTVVRIVEGLEGEVPMESRLAARFTFGKLPPWTRPLHGAITMTAGANGIALRSSTQVCIDVPDAISEFSVKPGERVWFVMQWYPGHEAPPDGCDPERALRETEEHWRKWSADMSYQGQYRDVVMRSLVTLKALTFEPTGGCIAAATTSLPEQLGGEKNWDYRYAWIRDSSYTIDALVACGYHEEAQAWRDWLLRVLAGAPEQLQIMYSVTGDRHLAEYTADWLKGYEDSPPVRIGNAAYTQSQLGIYGELMRALSLAHKAGIELDDEAWAMLSKLLNYVQGIWRQPDSGIWESRGEPLHYTHSRVMLWCAFNEAIEIANGDGRATHVEEWKRTRDAIHADVCANGFNKKRNAFVQAYENDSLDASLLTIPIVGFLPADDERMRGTIEAIERELLVDGFVFRESGSLRRPPLGVGSPKPQEGAFLACCCWLVRCYAAAGRTEDARRMLERLLAICNDVGLLSEEYDVERKRQLGNFPQVFSHATLVNAAMDLTQG